MKRWRTVVIVVLASTLLFAPPLWSWSGASGVHSVIALFESHVHPDLPFDQFAGGRLGIIKPIWDRSYLYVAYRYLSGPGFDASEQKAMVSLWDDWLGLAKSRAGSSQSAEDQQNADRVATEWIAARNKVPGVDPIAEIDRYRQAPAEYGSFDYANCNDSSFHTAAVTLDSMIGKFGLSSPQVEQWVDAQDQVFDNCSGTPPTLADDSQEWGKASEAWFQLCKTIPGVVTPGSYGEGDNCRARKYLALTATLETMIHDLGASNPKVKQWVDAQNQALVACGNGPHPAPDSTTAPAPEIPSPLTNGTPFENAQRTYQIASANFYAANFDTAARMFDAIAADSSSPWRQLAPYLVARATIRKATLSAEKNDHATLANAEAQLNKIIVTPGDDSVKHAAQRLLGFVDAQLHPEQREQELARAVMLPTSGEVLKQDVSDYIWMLEHGPATATSPRNDLTDWISTLHDGATSSNPPAPYSDTAAIAHSIAKWKETSSTPWLVAALSEVPASDPNAPALISAAENVKPDSPAYVTVTYHAARLLVGQGKTDEARRKLDSLLASRDRLPVSTANELAALRMTLARNLNELLAYAPRTPLGITDDGDDQELPSELTDQSLKQLAAGPLFDKDAAAVLTRWMPLSVLMQAAHSKTLPAGLRDKVTLAAFVRAILLGNEPAARELAPLVMESVPKLKPTIEAWLAAKSPDAQRFAAAYMMLQNPGLRYEVDPGPGRSTALDEIDSLRDNWWPSLVNQNENAQNYASFLSASERKTTDEEWQKLSAINAPNFLCTEAIEQAKSHPTDERAPEALYRCLRAVHLGCSNDKGTELARSAFQLLHHRYPDSPWAEKGKVWYKGDGCTNS